MKTLYIIRHAKSSWEFNVEDHKRPLNERGLQDAKLIASQLKTHNVKVDRVICSDAERTKMTAGILLNHLEIPNTLFELNSSLYDFEGNQVMEVIKKCDDNVQSLMIFGHNYALTSIVNALGSVTMDNLPTSGVVAIQFDVNHWNDIKKGETILTLYPKQFK